MRDREIVESGENVLQKACDGGLTRTLSCVHYSLNNVFVTMADNGSLIGSREHVGDTDLSDALFSSGTSGNLASFFRRLRLYW